MFEFATLLQPKINLFQFSLILINVTNKCLFIDHIDITSSLYKTDTSLRRIVKAGPESVRLEEV